MSNTLVQPYLALGGRAEEAIEFYKSALGAEVDMVMRFKESPEPMPGLPEGYDDKIMHASFKIGESLIMMSDGCGEEPKFEGFSLHVGVDTEEEADSMFAALSEGGEVKMPLEKTFWSPKFGMVADKFGVEWMISINCDEMPG